MRLFGTSRLENFVREHECSRVPLSAWRLEAEEAHWTSPDDVQARYVDAIVQPDRVVFNLKSLYNIDVKASFKQGILLIERVWVTSKSKHASNAANSASFRSKA